jgi:hypothetical protein
MTVCEDLNKICGFEGKIPYNVNFTMQGVVPKPNQNKRRLHLYFLPNNHIAGMFLDHWFCTHVNTTVSESKLRV